MLCDICPRKCSLPRPQGFCGMPAEPVVARAAAHHWEEPCISGARGSGAIFFSGCVLRCVFCQNSDISADRAGKKISVERLADIMRELVEEGVHNINFVTPTHYTGAIISALEIYRPPVPIVWNTGGYEREETVAALAKYVDVWLPDIKYFSSELSARYSAAPDYFSYASRAVRLMCKLSGPPVYNSEGIMTRGTLVRHMMLPSHRDDTLLILRFVRDELPPGTPISLMRQYTPNGRLSAYPEIDRRLTTFEYQKAIDFLLENGMTSGYTQERQSASSTYTPPFDETGV